MSDADRRHTAEQLALMMTEHGMQRMSARVMAAFIFTERPALTQGELAEELDVSSGSVSGAIKTLIAVGIVERVPAVGSRREHYRLRPDAWATLFTKQNQVVEGIMDMAERGLDVTEKGGHAWQRLDLMRDFYAFVLAELPAVVERWRQRRQQLDG